MSYNKILNIIVIKFTLIAQVYGLKINCHEYKPYFLHANVNAEI